MADKDRTNMPMDDFFKLCSKTVKTKSYVDDNIIIAIKNDNLRGGFCCMLYFDNLGNQSADSEVISVDELKEKGLIVNEAFLGDGSVAFTTYRRTKDALTLSKKADMWTVGKRGEDFLGFIGEQKLPISADAISSKEIKAQLNVCMDEAKRKLLEMVKESKKPGNGYLSGVYDTWADKCATWEDALVKQ